MEEGRGEGRIERDRPIECVERLRGGQLRRDPRTVMERQFSLFKPDFRVLWKALYRFAKRAGQPLNEWMLFLRAGKNGAPQGIGRDQETVAWGEPVVMPTRLQQGRVIAFAL